MPDIETQLNGFGQRLNNAEEKIARIEERSDNMDKKFVTEPVCKLQHEYSQKAIDEIKKSLTWANRQSLLGLIGIILTLIAVIWKNHTGG